MHESVKNYYGQVLQGTDDLLTDACCTEGTLPAHLDEVLANIHLADAPRQSLRGALRVFRRCVDAPGRVRGRRPRHAL
ncbi:MAG: hypothetical protein AAF184_14755 [Pseudomonadota bacterium]